MFKKIGLPLLMLLTFPLLVVLINRVVSWHYDQTYVDPRHAVVFSAHYKMSAIRFPGYLEGQTAYSKVIDSMYVDTIATRPVDITLKTHIDPKHYETYTGDIYLDTIRSLVRIESTEVILDAQGASTGNARHHHLTLNARGKMLSDSTALNPETATVYSNCYLIPDQLIPFQPWLDKTKSLSLQHFSKQHFDAGCLDPLRGWGSPNGAGICYFWSGTGYYNLKFHNEVLRFKSDVSSQAFLFSEDNDFSGGMKYYPVPKQYQHMYDVAFLVDNSTLYIITTK